MESYLAVGKSMLADTDTPVSAYAKLCGDQTQAFLLESGESQGTLGRYSIVAWDPLCTLRLSPEGAELKLNGKSETSPWQDFFDLARKAQEMLACRDLPQLPVVGSLVGYVGYDAIRLIEKLGPLPPNDLPAAELSYPSRFAVFDHFGRKLNLVAIDQSEEKAQAKIAEMEQLLDEPLRLELKTGRVDVNYPEKEPYKQAVKTAKEYILEGEIFQVVLSDRFVGTTDLDPLTVYRWLRVNSPSPYMFHMRHSDFTLVGSSPETLVSLEDGTVVVRPIAGTRGRSADPATDKALEEEMMASEKERAEHVMLVDLARNDAGRVSAYGTVDVSPYMIVERFSHVMHITSQVNGKLKPGLDAWDVFQAAFPAGTVSGAPKVRAMEIIDELETGVRGPYAGAVGHFGPGARMDTCIGIRTIQFMEDKFVLQVGAGIVADSDPEMEYQEICHKAAQGIAAMKTAAGGVK